MPAAERNEDGRRLFALDHAQPVLAAGNTYSPGLVHRSSLTASTPNSKRGLQHDPAAERNRAGTTAPIDPFCVPRAAMTTTKITAQIGG